MQLCNAGAGVIGDISVAKERGGYLGIFVLGPMVRGPYY